MSNEFSVVTSNNVSDVAAADGYGCDESKCVSQGPSWLFFDTPLTCYANDDWYPMACADGYQPRAIVGVGVDNSNNEPTIVWSQKYKYGTTKYPPMPFHYFTCW